MQVTLLGIVTLLRPVQLANASYPMLVTLLGITTFLRLVQPPNADPMLVTLLGIMTLLRLVQTENKLSGRVVIEFGMVILVKLVQ
jgi:hypothetical protein